MTKVKNPQGSVWLEAHNGGLIEATLNNPPTVTISTLVISNPQQWADASVSQNAGGDWLGTFSPASGSGITTPTAAISALLLGIGYGITTVVGSSPTHTALTTGINSQQNNIAVAGCQYVVSFMHYGTQIRLLTFSRGGSFRVRVDGKYVSTDPTAIGGTFTYRSIDVDFSGQGVKARRVEFEVAYGIYPYGVQCGTTDTIWTTPRRTHPRFYIIGDSFSVGTASGASGFRDMAHFSAQQLGFDDVTVDALGGTGYYKENAAAVSAGQTPWQNFGARVPLNIAAGKAQPDIIGVYGSINDQGWGTTTVKNNALTLFSYLASAVPSAKVFAVTFGEKAASTAQITPSTLGVQQAAAASPNVVGVLDLLPVLTGTGYVGHETGDGNRDIYISTDGAHPTLAAHVLYGQMIANYAARLI